MTPAQETALKDDALALLATAPPGSAVVVATAATVGTVGASDGRGAGSGRPRRAAAETGRARAEAAARATAAALASDDDNDSESASDEEDDYPLATPASFPSETDSGDLFDTPPTAVCKPARRGVAVAAAKAAARPPVKKKAASVEVASVKPAPSASVPAVFPTQKKPASKAAGVTASGGGAPAKPAPKKARAAAAAAPAAPKPGSFAAPRPVGKPVEGLLAPEPVAAAPPPPPPPAAVPTSLAAKLQAGGTSVVRALGLGGRGGVRGAMPVAGGGVPYRVGCLRKKGGGGGGLHPNMKRP